MSFEKIDFEKYDSVRESYSEDSETNELCIYRGEDGEVWLNKHLIHIVSFGIGEFVGDNYFKVESNADVLAIVEKTSIDLESGIDEDDWESVDLITEFCDGI